jgi:hypothetical protein
MGIERMRPEQKCVILAVAPGFFERGAAAFVARTGCLDSAVGGI